jgi:hypothetical protein
MQVKIRLALIAAATLELMACGAAKDRDLTTLARLVAKAKNEVEGKPAPAAGMPPGVPTPASPPTEAPPPLSHAPSGPPPVLAKTPLQVNDVSILFPVAIDDAAGFTWMNIDQYPKLTDVGAKGPLLSSNAIAAVAGGQSTITAS